jgi:large subunit ribosomal protein L24
MREKNMNNKSSVCTKFKKGDRVVAIAGNERGKIGTILRCVGERVVIQGLNIRKKHVKKSEQNPAGGIMSFEHSMHVSNIKLCVAEDTGVKLRTRVDPSGNRELYYKLDGQEITHRSLKNSNGKKS